MPASERTDRPSVMVAGLGAALLIAESVAARACRDALFLSSFPATELPKVMLASAAVGLPLVLFVSRAVARFGPAGVIPAGVALSGGLHALEWSLLERAPNAAVILLYVHASIAGAIAVSGFWSIVNERFDPHTVRRVAGSLAVSSAAGGLAGGLFARFAGGRMGPGAMLPTLALVSVLGALLLRALARRTQAQEAASPDASGMRSVTTSSYLRSIALLVVLTALSSSIVDFCFKAEVAGRSSSGPELVSFFAVFYAVTSVASVAFQLSVARWVLADLGLGAALAALPVTMLGFGFLGVVVPKAWVFVLLRGSTKTLETSLFRSAYEPLYAPLPVKQKRSAKTLIDVACDRVGEALGSGAVLGIAAFAPVLATRVGLVVAIAAAGVCAWLSIRLERGYVGELASSLRSGRVRLDESEMKDATTRLTMSQTQLELDRDALLRQIQELRNRGDVGAGAATPSLPPRAAGLAARVAALDSGDTERVLAALEGPPLEHEAIALVIPLLEHDPTADAADRALRKVLPKIVGQLVDALLDTDRPLRLRRRIPRLLRGYPHGRVLRGLSDALDDPEFELRYRAGLALRELARTGAKLRPAKNVVLRAAEREVEASNAVWKARSVAVAEEIDTPERSSTPVVLRDRALDHVFTLLGLAFDADSVELARRALSTDDRKLRGTALEYLEHVVPEPIRAGIWPYLQAGRAPRGAERSASEIVEDLKRSFG
jgi:hypothetical protein